MNGIDTKSGGWKYAQTALASALLLWMSQPPFAFWPLAAVSLVPFLFLVADANLPSRGNYVSLWLAATLYWLVTLQGLRFAHPLMFLGWMALSGYLAVYFLFFVALSRRMLARGVPLMIAAPIAWVGLECLRNYLLTGISAAMLGHTMVEVPAMIQIADMFGTYGVSFVLVSINVAIFVSIQWIRKQSSAPTAMTSCASAIVLLTGTILYGRMRLREEAGPPLATFALIQRGEAVEYEQDISREVEIFQNYSQQSVAALRATDQIVDAVVWPESMFTGGAPWMIADGDANVPEAWQMTDGEFQSTIVQRGMLYLDRARYVQSVLASEQGPSQTSPHLIAGCGVVHYGKIRSVYSGVVHIGDDGSFTDWYGKMHLMMFGEYVPIAPHIPGLRTLVPANLLLCSGDGPKRFMVGQTAIAPNICIETAVERVTLGQLAELHDRQQMPDVVVTVTNDGWFDDSSIIEHHLRCAQLVAVGCRRPLLSAANNGPTVWIDSRGRLIERMTTGTNGAIIATPLRDDSISLYLRIGDWPARILAILSVLFAIDAWVARRKRKRELAAAN